MPNNNTTKKLNNTAKGKKGEYIAKKYIISKGIKIIAENYHSIYGEIDIIGEKDEKIFFFEVKLRNSKKFGEAKESITKSKLDKLHKTILDWLSKNEKYADYEMHLILIAIDKNKISVLEISQ